MLSGIDESDLIQRFEKDRMVLTTTSHCPSTIKVNPQKPSKNLATNKKPLTKNIVNNRLSGCPVRSPAFALQATADKLLDLPGQKRNAG